MNVLIVDDILLNRILLSELVKKMGYTFLQAQNGKEAIQLIKIHNFDVVLMDIEMPVMNGLEAVREIRNLPGILKDTPVIALTAHNPDDFMEEFTSAGFNELITKPYLIDKVDKIINKYKK
ncbi:MAG: response regulator [Salinivirgaceae bacterium]|nr:response regulator [Salinivirgaceae bacterium]MDD4746626.1 response regulator [Salinivirgaceae bacterium]